MDNLHLPRPEFATRTRRCELLAEEDRDGERAVKGIVLGCFIGVLMWGVIAAIALWAS